VKGALLHHGQGVGRELFPVPRYVPTRPPCSRLSPWKQVGKVGGGGDAHSLINMKATSVGYQWKIS